jgi:hypothetical protein
VKGKILCAPRRSDLQVVKGLRMLSSGIKAHKSSLLSVAEKENSSCCRGEEIDNHPIQRIGKFHEEEADR